MQRRAAIGVAFLIWALFIVADWMMVDIRLHPSSEQRWACAWE